MLTNLQNEIIEVIIDSLGAEICSLKSRQDGTERFWNANPDIWPSHGPVLFPIVGRLRNDTYRLNQLEYKLEKHGFARRLQFELKEKTQTTAEFVLNESELTLNKYPFAFALRIKYSLDGNSVKIEYIVENKDDITMFFSVGAHPGFMCPMLAEEEFSDYYLEFSENETADILQITPDGYIRRETKKFMENEKIINLNHSLFENDALVFKGLNSSLLALKSKNHDKSVTVEFEGFPYLGIWTKIDAPYICIEPWYGLADRMDFDGDFSEKEGIMTLEQGCIFRCAHTISIN